MKGAINPNSTLHIQAAMRGHAEAANTRRLTALKSLTRRLRLRGVVFASNMAGAFCLSRC
jgi:hypothetical protein